MLENSAKRKLRENKMDDALRAQDLIKYAFPEKTHGNAEASQWAAYRKLRLRTLRRARAIWNGEAKRVDAWELDRLQEAELEQARKEYVGARNRIERLTQRANARRSHFDGAGHGPLE